MPKPSGRTRRGSIDHAAATSELPPGPAELSEIAAWPKDILNRFMEYDRQHQQGGMVHRVSEHMQRGVLGTSEFSGFDSQAEAARLLVLALEDQLGHGVRGFHWLSSSDWMETPQREVLQQISDIDGGFGCVFGDIGSTVAECVNELLDSIEPAVGVGFEARVQSRQSQLEVLMQNSLASPLDQTSWCHMHGRQCPIGMKSPLANGLQALLAVGMYQKPVEAQPVKRRKMRRSSSAPWASCETSSLSKCSPWWHLALQHMIDWDLPMNKDTFLTTVVDLLHVRRGRGPTAVEDDVLEDAGTSGSEVPWVACWGSTVCKAYSSLGAAEGSSADSERTHHVFVSQRHHRAKNDVEDFYWHENSDLYPVEQKQAVPLADSHVTKSIRINGVALGYPYNRPRTLTFGFKKDKFHWMGAEDVQDEFMAIFARKLQSTGDIYFLADPEEVREEYSQRAQGRNYVLPTSFAFDDVDVLTKIFPPGQVSRYFQWQVERPKYQALNGAFLADLDHNTCRGPVGGPLYPSMPTHSTTWSFSQCRLHSALEGFFVHGLLLHDACFGEHLDQRYKCKFKHVLEALPRRQKEELLGNSLFCPGVAAWMLYCLGNLQPRCNQIALPPSIPPSQPEEEPDEDWA